VELACRLPPASPTYAKGLKKSLRIRHQNQLCTTEHASAILSCGDGSNQSWFQGIIGVLCIWLTSLQCSLHSCFTYHNWNWQNQKWNPQMPTFPCTIYDKTKTKYLNNKILKLGTLKNQGVCHTMALPFTLNSILRQKKKNYGNSNISPCKNI
jgi:hypothetical protein